MTSARGRTPLVAAGSMLAGSRVLTAVAVAGATASTFQALYAARGLCAWILVERHERPEEEALTRVAGLLLVLLVAAAGAVVLAIVHQLVPLKGDLINVLAYGVLGGAAVAFTRYIDRNRGR